MPGTTFNPFGVIVVRVFFPEVPFGHLRLFTFFPFGEAPPMDSGEG